MRAAEFTGGPFDAVVVDDDGAGRRLEGDELRRALEQLHEANQRAWNEEGDE